MIKIKKKFKRISRLVFKQINKQLENKKKQTKNTKTVCKR